MWVSKGEYRRLLRQLRSAEQRAEADRLSLDLERAENRKAERHWANMFLRMRQSGSLPMPATPTESTKPHAAAFEPVLDPGELSAVIAAAEQVGINARDAENFLRGEKGLPPI